MNELADLPIQEEAPPQPPVTTEPIQTTAPEPPPEGETPPVDQPPDPATLKAEIDELERKRKKAEEDARYWREQKARERAEFFREKRGERETPPPADPSLGKEPSPSDYDDYNKYVDAKIAHEVNKAKITWDRDAAERVRRESQSQKEATLQTKIQEGFQKYQDFEEVALDPSVPITAVVKEILTESEMPADVAYYLGKNRAEAIQIARMTPISAARAIARIEAKIASQPPPAQPKKISNAPPPIKPIGSSQVVSKDPNKMTQREYEEWRRSNGARPF